VTGTAGVDSATDNPEKKGFLESLFGGGSDSESSGNVSVKSVTLKSDEIKELEFSTEEFNSSFSIISLSTENLKYEIPVSLPVLKEPEKEKSFRFEKSEIVVSMATNSNATRKVYLHNTGEEVLENISLLLSGSLVNFVSLSPLKIEELNPNSSVQIEILMNSDAESRNYSGQITAKTPENLSAYLALSLNFIQGFVPSEEEDGEVFQTCSEMQGKKCSDNEKCVGNSRDSLDGICCLGNCIKKKESSLGRIIGIILFIAIAGFLVWFYLKKYKKAKTPAVDLLKVARGKT